MKAAVVIGLILVVLGVCVLAYFASPVRMLMLSYSPHKIDVKVPIAGGLSLACGIALLFLSRARKP